VAILDLDLGAFGELGVDDGVHPSSEAVARSDPDDTLDAGVDFGKPGHVEDQAQFLPAPLAETGKPVSCLLVDESQFLTEGQVDDLLRIAIVEGTPVLAYGIRTDFQTVAFPGSRRLLEIAHSLEELKTICRCGRKAVFNARKIDGRFVFDGDQVAIDGVDVTYESLCGSCYLYESGGVLNSGWRPKVDFSYRSGPDADFT
jgi:thymidine kinase